MYPVFVAQPIDYVNFAVAAPGRQAPSAAELMSLVAFYVLLHT